ncbi:MAG: sigma-70 family RNA polymerase sigma factor [Deltaproteobacteria bacterium]|nr:sigma-70 family RNA polymerase sigma factor [Deltaproteobacteria bacterium]
MRAEDDIQAERQIVEALKRGEETAFVILVRTHQHRVYGLCLRMLADRQEAEDLAQEVFLTVFRAIQDFREESRLSTWLYRITRNHCLNRLKFLKRRAHEKQLSFEDARQADLHGQAIHRPVAAQVPRPDRLVEGKQIEAIVNDQIAALNEEHRELVVLRDLEHLSYEEIRSITGLPIGTIKSRLHRARMDLARRMAPFLEEA